MLIQELIDFILHFDAHLGQIISLYGPATYFILFMIIFLETGIVLTPFLPGDSLLFVAGTFAAQGFLNIYLLIMLLIVAAILGDSTNFYIGRNIGLKAFSRLRFFKPEYLKKTEAFYKKHGGKTIIFARFIPIIRTFAPFVAGLGKMNYQRFVAFNIIGAVIWVTLFTTAGFYFGTLPFVEENLTLIIFIIILISILPPIISFIKSKFF